MNAKSVKKTDIEGIIAKQDAWGFNRQLNPPFINEWDNSAEYELIPTIEHQHKHGDRCEPHLRTVFVKNKKEVIAFIDMPYEEWNALNS